MFQWILFKFLFRMLLMRSKDRPDNNSVWSKNQLYKRKKLSVTWKQDMLRMTSTWYHLLKIAFLLFTLQLSIEEIINQLTDSFLWLLLHNFPFSPKRKLKNPFDCLKSRLKNNILIQTFEITITHLIYTIWKSDLFLLR